MANKPKDEIQIQKSTIFWIIIAIMVIYWAYWPESDTDSYDEIDSFDDYYEASKTTEEDVPIEPEEQYVPTEWERERAALDSIKYKEKIIKDLMILGHSEAGARRDAGEIIAREQEAINSGYTIPCPICYYNAYNCESFTTQEWAQECYEWCGYSDIHDLDRDEDGRACE